MNDIVPVVEFGEIDVSDVIAWITAIPFERWPQQYRLADGEMRPAMINDPAWYDFERVTSGTSDLILLAYGDREAADTLGGRPGVGEIRAYEPMLSVVMPGHRIEPHRDERQPGWLTRVHVPLTTNDWAVTDFGCRSFHMAVGRVYLVDIRQEHGVRNDGDTPRIHFMFDVRRLP